MNQQGQIFDIHVLRSVGCLMVVLVHVTALYYVQRGSWEDVILFINQASRFGTPIFAVISGLLLFLQVRKRGFLYKKFVTSRFTKIIVPFLFWSAFYLFYLWLVYGADPLRLGVKTLIFEIAFGETYSHLYFISVVLQFYLIFPLLQYVKSKIGWVVLLIFSALLHIYAINYMPLSDIGGVPGLIVDQRAFLPKWLFFFILGGFLAYHWEWLKYWANKMSVTLFAGVILIFYFAAVEYEWGGDIGSNRITNIINLPIIILFIMSVSEKIARNELLNSLMTRLGAMSMGIYLIHPVIINILQRNLPLEVWSLLLFPIWFLLVMALSIIIIILIQKLPFGSLILTVPVFKQNQKFNYKEKEN